MNERLRIRPAGGEEADPIARLFLASRATLTFLPNVHTDEETFYFIAHIVLRDQDVYVAETNGEGLRRTRLGRMAVSESNEVPAPQERRTATADGSWMLWTALGVGGIWVAVVLISLLSPDMVSGSEQEHQKVAAFVTWFWGGVGTLVFLWTMGRLRGDAMWRPTWIGLSSVTLGIWALATISAIALPVVETGSDPTQIPLGAVVGPVAAAMLTAIAGAVTSVFRRGPGPR